MKPFIKWLGGKTDIKDKIFLHFPKIINNYFEPFVGGGAIFIQLLQALENDEIHLQGSIYISDINENLINLYLCIKDNVNDLLLSLDHYKMLYINSKDIEYPKRHSFNILQNETEIEIQNKGKVYCYYWMRDQYNNGSLNVIDKSALFIILNKTCFRGLYRTGKNGFNVPFGNYSTPSMYDEAELNIFSNLFNKYDINFKTDNFNYLKDKVATNDFVYFDPPYCVLDKNSFTSYNETEFKETEQQQLYDLCCYLQEKEIKFIQSNSNCDYILELYKNFNIVEVPGVKRRINSKNPQSTITELLIM
jgi:DNA adenine methylase